MPFPHANERLRRDHQLGCTMRSIVRGTSTLISPSPLQRAEIVRRRVSVGGRPTIVHELAATAPCKLQIMVVPGNPGLHHILRSSASHSTTPDDDHDLNATAGMSGFYLPFMRALHEGLGGAASVSAVTHLGLGGLSGGQIFGLEEQIEHKREYLEAHLLRPGSPPCAVIGHSIGAPAAAGQL